MRVAHERGGRVAFVDHRFERLDARRAARIAEGLGRLLGAVAQRVPGERRQVHQRRCRAGRQREVDEPGGRHADQVAVELRGELHRGARARGAQRVVVEQDEQAAVGHGGLGCRGPTHCSTPVVWGIDLAQRRLASRPA